MEDRSRPEIRNVYPSNGSRVKNLSPRIRFNITDIGSGIEEDGVKLWLNGVKAVCEFDPPRDAAYYRIPRPLVPGKHRIRIEVTDRVGNKSIWKGAFSAVSRSGGR